MNDDSRAVLIYKVYILSEVFNKNLDSFKIREFDEEIFKAVKTSLKAIWMSVDSEIWNERFKITVDERAELNFLVKDYFGSIAGSFYDLYIADDINESLIVNL